MRTPPWEASSKGAKVPKSLIPASEAPIAFSKDLHDVTKQITGGFSKTKATTKSKNKTRGVAEFHDDDQAVPELGPTLLPTSRATFKVDKRALKVLRTLFYSPNSPDQPGEVAWSGVLHAMTSVGFGAEKLRSSAWQFTPRNSIAGWSIQLHEPHPGNKLPFVLARHYGRSLNIAFGWTIDSFELA